MTGFQDKARRTQVVTDAKQVATAVDSLISDSASGTLDATHGLEAVTTATATIDANEAIVLVGLSSARITELTVLAGGGFTIKETINGVAYTATRTTTALVPTVTP